jgi:hypothetical protein
MMHAGFAIKIVGQCIANLIGARPTKVPVSVSGTFAVEQGGVRCR